MYKRGLCLVVSLVALAPAARAAEIWSGYDFAFTKPAFFDHTVAANQDRITDNVWITRASTAGIFNIAQEGFYADFSSPIDTEWAFGTTGDIGSLSFSDWKTAVASNPPASVGQNMVVHLITDDIHIDIRFTAWSLGSTGGDGFSYVRGIPAPASLASLSLVALLAARRRR